ncbi:MAG: GNAT family N-acetyltransferase [Pseudomonadota bacterium]
MEIREAVMADAPQMSAILKHLTAAGKRISPDDEAFIRKHYISDPGRIRCSVAVREGTVVGFQSLKRAEPGNAYGVTPGWGIIGTHIGPAAARQGVGRALFEVSRAAALDAGVTRIDARIAADNPEALAYYNAMGFVTYRTPEGLVCKVWSGSV